MVAILKSKGSLVLISVLILLLLIWSPWITKSYAENKVAKRFEEKNMNILDGCGFNCAGCGVKESHRTLFGYSVKIEYSCGLIPSDSPEYHQTATKFVSFLGTRH